MFMKLLLELNDNDIFPATVLSKLDDSWHDRVAVKVIIFDNQNKVALFGTTCLLLPGGGVEAGESLEVAVKRECLEEVGCNVDIVSEVGRTLEFRHKIKCRQETHCFVAKVVGKKGVTQSQQEDELHARVEWFNIDDALKLLKKNKKTMTPLLYNSQFNVRTHIAFLEEYISENSRDLSKGL